MVTSSAVRATNGHGATMAARSAVGNWKHFFSDFKMPHPKGKPDKQPPLTHRVAHVLDWAARKNPGAMVPYNVLYMVIMGLERLPLSNNEDVERLRKRLPASRPILQRLYKRDIYNLSGVGVRATVDGVDIVKTRLEASVRRVVSAHENLNRTAALVDVAKLPEHGPNKGCREFFVKTVSPIKQLSDRIARLALPPAPAAKTPSDTGEPA